MEYENIIQGLVMLGMLQIMVFIALLFALPEVIYEHFSKMRQKEEEKAAEEAMQRRQAESERADYEAFEEWRSAQQMASESATEIMPGSRLNPAFADDTVKRRPKKAASSDPSGHGTDEWS